MADTSPVAHEGNPKEDSITISGGDVLSTATLGVVLPYVPPVEPPIGPIVEPPFIVLASNSAKYDSSVDFDVGSDGTTNSATTQNSFSDDLAVTNFKAPAGSVIEYSRRGGVAMAGFIAWQPTTNWWECTNDTTQNTASWVSHTGKPHYGGDFYEMMFHMPATSPISLGSGTTTNTVSIFCKASIPNASDGITNQPISGVAVGVNPISTVDHFYGIVCAYDFYTHIQYVMRYNGESLMTLAPVISSAFFTGYPSSNNFDAPFTATLTYQEIITWDTSGCPFAQTSKSTRFNLSFSMDDGGHVISPSNISLPFVGPNMNVALVNIASSASHNAEPLDAIIWKEVYAGYSFSAGNVSIDAGRFHACGV